MSAAPATAVELPGPIGPLSCLMRPAQADAPTLVLLHGIQGTRLAWAGVCGLLPPDWGYVLPDLRGRGQSVAPDDPAAYGLDGFAADLAALIAALEGRIMLVGWSMGVLVSLAYLAAHGSERIGALVLASGTARPGAQARWFQATNAKDIAQEAEARAQRLSLTAYARPEAVAGAWMAARQADLTPTLSEVNVPTLVLHGSADDQCPLSHGELLATTIPQARLKVWPGGGHNLMAEDPRGMAEAIAGFVGDATGHNLEGGLAAALAPR